MQKGDYVLATKYSDGDPGDAWAVGYYVGIVHDDRHQIDDGNGKVWRAGGYRRVGKITQAFGEWLLASSEVLEASPPGSVDLWGMRGVTAMFNE